MDLLTTVVVLLIAVALIGWVAAAIDGRPLEAFGSGFVGYRPYGWPHGVQEEDAIHFAPTAWHERPSIDDDGPGVPEEAREKIFERFYTHRPHQPFGQNSGLGLSISKHIIEAHGGRIRAENRQPPAAAGEPAAILGARFIVRLPAM